MKGLVLPHMQEVCNDFIERGEGMGRIPVLWVLGVKCMFFVDIAMRRGEGVGSWGGMIGRKERVLQVTIFYSRVSGSSRRM